LGTLKIKAMRWLGVIQFEGEFLNYRRDHGERREKKALKNNAQKLCVLCGLRGKFLPPF